MIIRSGEGRYAVALELIRHDEGMTAILTGGEKTHVGAVVLAIPRGSLTGEGGSCDCYVLPVPGHKDDIVARKAAEALCVALGAPICVSAGIHIDHAETEEIKVLSKNCEAVTAKAVRMIKETDMKQF